jgi:hypothetical protein
VGGRRKLDRAGKRVQQKSESARSNRHGPTAQTRETLPTHLLFSLTLTLERSVGIGIYSGTLSSKIRFAGCSLSRGRISGTRAHPTYSYPGLRRAKG